MDLTLVDIEEELHEQIRLWVDALKESAGPRL